MNDITEIILDKYKKVIGAILGFLTALFWAKYGFFYAVILVIFVCLGYYIGGLDRETIKKRLADKLLKGEKK
ncbi:MAG: DUF2273 domain-containing protein [Fusobacteriota bacterium]